MLLGVRGVGRSLTSHIRLAQHIVTKVAVYLQFMDYTFCHPRRQHGGEAAYLCPD